MNNNNAPIPNKTRQKYVGEPVPCDLDDNDRPSTPNQPTSSKSVKDWSKDLANQRRNKTSSKTVEFLSNYLVNNAQEQKIIDNFYCIFNYKK